MAEVSPKPAIKDWFRISDGPTCVVDGYFECRTPEQVDRLIRRLEIIKAWIVTEGDVAEPPTASSPTPEESGTEDTRQEPASNPLDDDP